MDVAGGAGSVLLELDRARARTRLARAGSSLRLLLLAGAPIARSLLRDVMDLWPECDVRTPTA